MSFKRDSQGRLSRSNAAIVNTADPWGAAGKSDPNFRFWSQEKLDRWRRRTKSRKLRKQLAALKAERANEHQQRILHPCPTRKVKPQGVRDFGHFPTAREQKRARIQNTLISRHEAERAK